MSEYFLTVGGGGVVPIPQSLLATFPKELLDSVTESDDDLQHREFSFKVDDSSIDLENRTCEFIFSTEAIDSHDEIVKQDWEKRLDRYRNNPTVLYGHNRASGFFGGTAEETLPIGYCESVGVVKGQLRGRVRFVDEKANPLAERVWQGVIQKSIRATSVGFRPHTVKWEMINDVEQLVLSDNELYEVSIVPMGSNHEAVRLSADRRNRERQRLLGLATKTEGNAMTPEEVKKYEKDAAEAKEKAALLEAQLTAEKEKHADLERRTVAAEEAAEKAAGEQLKLRAQAIVSEITLFKGKKMVPAQEALYKELRCGPQGETFRKYVELGADVGLASSIVPPEGTPPGSISAGNNALLKEVEDLYAKALAEIE